VLRAFQASSSSRERLVLTTRSVAGRLGGRSVGLGANWNLIKYNTNKA